MDSVNVMFEFSLLLAFFPSVDFEFIELANFHLKYNISRLLSCKQIRIITAIIPKSYTISNLSKNISFGVKWASFFDHLE